MKCGKISKITGTNIKICGIENAPVFCPIVAPYYCGMEVTVPLFKKDIKGDVNNIKEIYKEYYKNGLVKFTEVDESGFLSANLMAGRDDMIVGVYGNEDRFTLVARFDNLGAGLCGGVAAEGRFGSGPRNGDAPEAAAQSGLRGNRAAYGREAQGTDKT